MRQGLYISELYIAVMRKNRIWLLAVAVILVGATVVMALNYTPISSVLTGSNTAATPTLNGPFWLVPIPASVTAGAAVAASFTIGNPYPFSLVNLLLVMNFTGSAVTSTCVTSGNCLGGSVTAPGSGTIPFTFCATCSPTTSKGNPEFVITASIPTLPSGITTMSLSLDFRHAGTYNQQVFFALNTPYP